MSTTTFEKLHRPFVLLGSRTRFESAEVASFACFGVEFSGVETVLAGFELAYHRLPRRMGVEDWHILVFYNTREICSENCTGDRTTSSFVQLANGFPVLSQARSLSAS